MYPYTKSERDTVVLLQSHTKVSHGSKNSQTSPDSPLCVIFMGLGIAKVDKQTITQKLSGISLVALDDFRADVLVGTYHVPIVFGIELGGEFGGIHQITKHHSQLPSFRVRRRGSRERCNLRGVLFLGSRLLGSLVCLRGDSLCVTSPDQYRAFFVHRQSFGFDQFVFEVFEILVIEGKPSFQGSIRDPFLPLEQFKDLGENVIEGHG
jgi:hypothetical protein